MGLYGNSLMNYMKTEPIQESVLPYILGTLVIGLGVSVYDKIQRGKDDKKYYNNNELVEKNKKFVKQLSSYINSTDVGKYYKKDLGDSQGVIPNNNKKIISTYIGTIDLDKIVKEVSGKNPDQIISKYEDSDKVGELKGLMEKLNNVQKEFDKINVDIKNILKNDAVKIEVGSHEGVHLKDLKTEWQYYCGKDRVDAIDVNVIINIDQLSKLDPEKFKK